MKKISTEMISALQRRFKKHFPKKTWEEIDEYFLFTSNDELLCEYCYDKLYARQPYPHRKVVSLDHKKPKALGGKNSFENIAICCCECNIVKGTMDDKTFKELHSILNQHPNLKNRVFKGLFWGRLANKIKRENIKDKDVLEYV